MNFKEKPGIEFEPWMLELGFVDVSWVNDNAAYTEVQLEGPVDDDNSEGVFLSLGVCEADPSDRENQEWKRYSLSVVERGPHVDVSMLLCATDDQHRVRALVEALIMARGE